MRKIDSIPALCRSADQEPWTEVESMIRKFHFCLRLGVEPRILSSFIVPQISLGIESHCETIIELTLTNDGNQRQDTSLSPANAIRSTSFSVHPTCPACRKITMPNVLVTRVNVPCDARWWLSSQTRRVPTYRRMAPVPLRVLRQNGAVRFQAVIPESALGCRGISRSRLGRT